MAKRKLTQIIKNISLTAVVLSVAFYTAACINASYKYSEYYPGLKHLSDIEIETTQASLLFNGFYSPSNIFNIYTNDNAFEEYRTQSSERAKKCLMYLNTELLEEFYQQGWRIVITDDVKKHIESTEYLYNTETELLSGCCSYTQKKIFILDDMYTETTILHEMGHFLDYITGDSSSTDEFIEITSKEKKQSNIIANVSENGISQEEYFAEAFKTAILFPEETKKDSPLTYEYIMNIYNNINE